MSCTDSRKGEIRLKKKAFGSNKAMLLAGALLLMSVIVVVFAIPVIGGASTENRMKETFSSEFSGLEKVEMKKTEKLGSYYRARYMFYEKSGNLIGAVDVNADNLDVLAIYYFNHELTPGEPKVGFEEAEKRATDCILKHFSANLEDYALIDKKLACPQSDVGDKNAYAYQFTWQKSMNGIFLTDTIYIEVSAVTNEITLALGPSGNCLVPSSTEGFSDAMAKKDQMVAIAKSSCAPAEELFNQHRGFFQKESVTEYTVTTKEEARLVYAPSPKTGEGPGMLLWNVEIVTEFYDEADLSTPVWASGRIFSIDASNGEVLFEDGTV